MTQRVFIDANVIVSRTLRDWLFMLRINTGGMFTLHTTEDVLAEAFARFRDLHPNADGAVVSQMRKRIIETLDELVDDFDGSVDYPGSDPHDRHVHAGAIAAKSDILLTQDLALQQMGQDASLPYSVYGADDFFCLVDDSSPIIVQRTAKQQLDYYRERNRKTGKTASVVQYLQSNNCPDFASRVNGHLRTLSGVPQRRRPIVAPASR